MPNCTICYAIHVYYIIWHIHFNLRLMQSERDYYKHIVFVIMKNVGNASHTISAHLEYSFCYFDYFFGNTLSYMAHTPYMIRYSLPFEQFPVVKRICSYLKGSLGVLRSLNILKSDQKRIQKVLSAQKSLTFSSSFK